MRNKNYRDKFMQGAEGADLEKKQILEDQCRAASETLFKKRRELQKLQKDYDDDARRLMEFRTKQQGLGKQLDDINLMGQRLDKEMNDQADKIERATRTQQSKLNNVKSVKGQGFESGKESMEISTELERLKTQHLINAIK